MRRQKTEERKMNNKKKVGKIVAAVAACLALAVVILSSFTVVDAGHTGVIMTFGAVSDTVLSASEGIYPAQRPRPLRAAPTPAQRPRPLRTAARTVPMLAPCPLRARSAARSAPTPAPTPAPLNSPLGLTIPWKNVHIGQYLICKIVHNHC